MATELAVVIVGMNTRDWVRGCLQSLRAHDDVALEIVVVDNCSEDGSCEMVEEAFPFPRPRSYATARPTVCLL